MKSKSVFRLVRSGSPAACILAAALAALLVAQPASADIRTWDNGNANFLWADPINWDGDLTLPGIADTAVFGATGVGNVDLNATSQTLSALSIGTVGYTFSNGTLSLNTINNTFTNGTIPLISANVTDQSSAGLTINQHIADCSGFTINGQIAIANTGATALQVVGNTQRTGVYTLGSTTLANSVAGGVSINSRLNGGVDFQGAWTIGGDFRMINGSSIDNGGAHTQLMGAITIGGDLISSPSAGHSATPAGIDVWAGSDVRVTGNLVLQGPTTFAPSLRIYQPLRLGGAITVANGVLGVAVTDPFLDSAGLTDTLKAITLGAATDTLNAAVSITAANKTLNNPITVVSGGSGAAILQSSVTATGVGNKVTFANTITLNRDLAINASNTAGAILDVTGQITGAQAVVVNSTGALAGTVALSNAGNSYSGGTIVNSGFLQANVLGALGGSGRNVAVNAPAVLSLGYTPATTLQSDLLSRIVTTSSGAVALTADSSENLDFSAAGNDFSALSLGAVGTRTFTGTLTPNGTTYRLGGGGGTLVFTPGGGTFDSTMDLVINGNGLTGTVDFGGLSKSFGAITVAGGTLQNGTLTCSSYSLLGGTVTATLNGTDAEAALTKTGGGTLTFSGSTPQAFTGGVTVNAGILLGNFANLTPPTDLFNSANVLTLGGGTLSLTGKNNLASSQTFASTTLSANRGSKITLARTGSGSMTVVLNEITRNTGSTLNFTAVPDTSTILATTTNTNTNDILGPWASVGVVSGTSGANVKFATVNGSSQIVAYDAATPLAEADFSDMDTATENYSFNTAAATTVALTGAATGNTLRFTGTNTLLIQTNGNDITLNGLLDAATNNNNNVTIARTSGAGSLMIGAAKDLVLNSGGRQAIIISAPIINYDPGTGPEASALTYHGTFEDNDFALNLTGVNTYSGGTTINSGRVKVTNSSAFGAGPVTINSGARLRIDSGGFYANTLTLNGGLLEVLNFNGWSGPVTLAATSQISTGYHHGAPSSNEISGNIDGPGGLTTLAGNSHMLLSGTNTYAGPTTISVGAIQFKGPASLYNGDTSKWTPANITVNSGNILALNIGGVGEFSGAQAGTLITNLTTGTNNNGLKAGSIIYLDPRYAGGTPVEISSAITDSTGPGGGMVNLTIGQSDGSATNTVVLSGDNTYSGKTTIDRYMHINVSVSSFNSVFTNPALGTVHSASSSLGAPTTVANGIINLLSEVRDVALIYTGTGETTDRVIHYAGTNGHLHLDQSGSGLLKFVSSITSNTNRNLTLRGSTSGAGEIAAAIGTSFGGGVTKTGTGTWTLSGTNSYGGATTVSQGTLLINGTNSGAGAVNVSANASLGGTGSIGSNTTIAATGKLAFNLSTAADSHDKLDVTGVLAFSGASVLDITASGVLPGTGVYTLVTAAGGITGVAPATLNLPEDWEATVSISGDNKSLLLDVTSTGSASDYDIWAGPSGYNLSGGPDDDDDGDGMSNHEEYAFGLIPTSGASVNPISQQLNKVTGLFKYTRRATPATTGLTYSYEWSTTLGNDWAAFTPDVDPPVSNDASPVEEITVEVPDALLANPALFLRVKTN